MTVAELLAVLDDLGGHHDIKIVDQEGNVFDIESVKLRSGEFLIFPVPNVPEEEEEENT